MTQACACGPTVSFISPTPADNSSQSSDPEIKLSTVGHGSLHYAFTDFDHSLLSLWRFEGNPNDEIGGSDGVWNGTENYDTGNFGSAGNFDGSSYIDVNLPDVIDSSFTISAWVNLNSLTWSGALISDANGHLIQIGGSNDWQFDSTYGSVTATTGVWTNVVGVYDSSNHTETLYVNGEYVSSASADRSILQNINIGRREDGFYINGKIDDVILFTRALGSDEVSSLYDASLHQYQHTFSGLSYGDHTFTGYAVDLVGNTNTGERTFTLTESSTQPHLASHRSSVRSRVKNLIAMGKTEDANKLIEEFSTQFSSSNTPVTSPPPITISRILKIKMNGDDIKWLQGKLGGLVVDGNFGSKTKAAVILFQKNHGLIGDGIVGPETIKILNLQS